MNMMMKAPKYNFTKTKSPEPINAFLDELARKEAQEEKHVRG
jgi:hypothetical protein